MDTLDIFLTAVRQKSARFFSGRAAQGNFNSLMNNPNNIAKVIAGFRDLYDAHNVYEPSLDVCNFVAQHDNPQAIASIIGQFATTRLFKMESAHSPSNLLSLSTLTNPENFAQILHDEIVVSRLFNMRNVNCIDDLKGLYKKQQEDFEILIKNQNNLNNVINGLATIYGCNSLYTPSLIIRNTIATHANPGEMAAAISILHEQLKEPIYFDAIANHKSLTDAACALNYLYSANLLPSQQNLNYFQSATPSLIILMARRHIALLRGVNAQANFEALINHPNPKHIEYALLNLQNFLVGDAAQTDFLIIMNHPNSQSMHEASNILRCNNSALLTGPEKHANFDAIMGHLEPQKVAHIFYYLQKSNLLAEELAQHNRDAVIRSNHLHVLDTALSQLQHNRLLTQSNFTKLITHSAMLFNNTAAYLWSWMTQLTEAQFEAMIHICETHQHNAQAGTQAFVTYVHEMLGTNQHQDSINTTPRSALSRGGFWPSMAKIDSPMREDLNGDRPTYSKCI